MKKQKYKRDYLPKLRRLTRELEDAIIERNHEKEKSAIVELQETLNLISNLKYVKERV